MLLNLGIAALHGKTNSLNVGTLLVDTGPDPCGSPTTITLYYDASLYPGVSSLDQLATAYQDSLVYTDSSLTTEANITANTSDLYAAYPVASGTTLWDYGGSPELPSKTWSLVGYC